MCTDCKIAKYGLTQMSCQFSFNVMFTQGMQQHGEWNMKY